MLGGVHGLSVGQQCHGQVVAGLRAVPDRPPQVRLRYEHGGHAGVAVHRDAGLLAAHSGQQLQPGGARALDVHVDLHPAGAVGVHGHQRACGGEPGGVPALQPDGLPDARGLQVGAPVPAERAGHLADHVERVRVGVVAPAQLRLDLLGVGQGGAEGDHQLVRAPAQRPAHVEAVAAVHVPRGAEQLAVQLDRGHRVEAVEDQLDPLVGAGRVRLERERVAPVRAVHPGEVRLDPVEVGIGDQPGGQQVEVGAAGHLRPHAPARHGGGNVPRHSRQLPAVVQGLVDHRIPAPRSDSTTARFLRRQLK